MNNDNDPQPSIWPPPIVPDQTSVMPEITVRKATPIALGSSLFFGFLVGLTLSLFCGVSLFFIFIKIGGAQMLHGASLQERLATFYAETTVKILNLSVPLLFYIWLRTRYHSFAMGLLIGGSFINLLFLLWYFFGL